MARHRAHDLVARGLRLPVHAQRGNRVVLAVRPRRGAVEHIVTGEVHQRKTVSRSDARQRGDTGDVGGPRRDPPFGVSAASTAVYAAALMIVS